MIARILGEGQYDVPDSALDRLDELDEAVERAVEAGDEPSFAQALGALLDRVREVGTRHAEDALDASDVILPPNDASLAEVREMLTDDGLIPG